MIALAGRRTSVKETSPWPPRGVVEAHRGEHPLDLHPGVSSGTSTIECWW